MANSRGLHIDRHRVWLPTVVDILPGVNAGDSQRVRLAMMRKSRSRLLPLPSPARPVVIPPGLKPRVIRLNSAEFGSLPGVRGNG